ncbi:MAG TPA: hypothetical protein GXX62_07775 [Alcaligenaceae bacterium]|nr:hypothetical protein [Alcaligenaceae bacterium]
MKDTQELSAGKSTHTGTGQLNHTEIDQRPYSEFDKSTHLVSSKLIRTIPLHQKQRGFSHKMMNSSGSFPADCELIETMRLHKAGHVLLLALHLKRLQRSAQAFGYVYDQQRVLAALQPYLLQNYDQPQRLRLTLNPQGKVTVQCSPLATTAQPVRIALSPTPVLADPWVLRHKTTQRAHWTQGESWLQQHPSFFDVIYYDQNGFITEGGRSNIYVWSDQQWITPPMDQALLGGVQRQFILDQGWAVEGPVSQHMLLNAPRVRVSNALRGWLDATLCV